VQADDDTFLTAQQHVIHIIHDLDSGHLILGGIVVADALAAEGDEVVGVCICRENATILTVTENGKGRRSDIDTYRITARGGKGIRNYDAAKDKVAAVKIVDDVDDVLLSSQEGIIIRLHANEIPVQSRYGSGVRVMRLGENDKVMVLARTDHDDEAQTETVEAEEGDEPTAEQLAAMEAADEASASEAPAED
jgi:DNA gyrase subunit A